MKKFLIAAAVLASIALVSCKKETDIAPVPEVTDESWKGFMTYMGEFSKEMEKMSENLQK